MKDIIKFSDDLTTDKETSRDKQEIELFFIIEDCIELLDTILVYQQINNIDACANRLLFVTYYGIIDKALAYRIIMGLSKLFDSDSNSRTILKVINSFSQTKEPFLFLYSTPVLPGGDAFLLFKCTDKIAQVVETAA